MSFDESLALKTVPAAAPLLATKLFLPAPRARAVTRPRLVARLMAGLRGRLTLIAAPAGFGKSTLLAQALRESPGEPAETPQRFAWVALEPDDNDPTRFWGYVAAALERASPGVGAGAQALLRAAPAEVEPAVAELLNALAAHPADVALVLDDYHAVTSPAIHAGISFLLEHAPPHFHLVIASRTDPPLPLPRWRARGELVELRAADLRFTSDEATQFLGETMGLRLDDEAAAALESRTEGWAAGLQLAALSLQGHADVRGFIAGFSGSHRHVVDYLGEEVLNRQPEHIRAFLLQTSVLERMCGPLCDAVLLDAEAETGAAGAGAYSQIVLNEIERANLLLIPLDDERRWYRYHHLFADLLRHRLEQERPALVPELHRRAARWFEQQGMAAEALNHAAAAADADLLARLLARHGARFAATGETQTLQRWLDAVPRERLLGSPQLCLTQAQVLMLHRRILACEPYLQAAEAALPGPGEPDAVRLRGELLGLRAHIAIERGAFADALGLARQALTLLPESEHWGRSNLGLLLGYALMVLGQTSEAVEIHSQNISRSRAAGHQVSALFSATEVVKLRVLQGRLSEARAAAERSLGWVAAEGWQQLPPTSALHIWRGNVLIEQGDFPAAGEELATAIRLTQHGPGITQARAHTFLARLRQLQGDRAGADAALALVEEICRDWGPSGERAFFDAYVARVRLLQGDAAAARRWASGRAKWSRDEPPSYFREIELLTLARLAVLDASASEAQVAEALELLGWLREHALAAGRGAVVIETLALEALALARRGEASLAHDRLDAALAQAAPEGYIGLFAELGAPMGDLLAASARRRGHSDPVRGYTERLLAVIRHEQPAESAADRDRPPALRSVPARAAAREALTERELEVLRLFAAGMTSPEIAQHFVVSINTVKTQLKSIYSKLDAHSRAEVVARAREAGLLP